MARKLGSQKLMTYQISAKMVIFSTMLIFGEGIDVIVRKFRRFWLFEIRWRLHSAMRVRDNSHWYVCAPCRIILINT
jgi:hypothetical protein